LRPADRLVRSQVSRSQVRRRGPAPISTRRSGACRWRGPRHRRRPPAAEGPRPTSPQEVRVSASAARPYELLLILDPTLDERTVAPSIDTFLNVVRQGEGTVENVDVWGKRR